MADYQQDWEDLPHCTYPLNNEEKGSASPNGFSLLKGAFHDTLALRYDWPPSRLPSSCACGSIEHAFSCPKGGFPSIRYSRLCSRLFSVVFVKQSQHLRFMWLKVTMDSETLTVRPLTALGSPQPGSLNNLVSMSKYLYWKSPLSTDVTDHTHLIVRSFWAAIVWFVASL